LNTVNKHNNTPLVSVALPVYNGEKYLAEALDSILAQTFTNFEFIIVDDGSTDNSLFILREYEQKDSRIRLISRENRNVAATLNEIMFLARGKWFARMDQDDIALPQRFERQLAWLEATGADITSSWIRRFGTSDKRIIKLRQTDEAIKMEMLFCSPFAHPSVIVRTSMIKELMYDEIRWEAEDYDLWERAAEAGWKMTNIPEVLLYYRMHPEQISSKKANRQLQLTLQIQHRYWKYVFKMMGLDQKLIDEVLKTYSSEVVMPNMDAVDAALVGLLQHSHGEARVAVLSQVTRLYFRVAADCPDVVSRWSKFFPDLQWHKTFLTKVKLWLLCKFKIRPGGGVYKLLRNIYIMLSMSINKK
jgi:GT2 family glycosyltransferase